MKTHPRTATCTIVALAFCSAAAAQTVPGQTPAADEVDYLQQLPLPADLAHFAAAQNMTVLSIQQVNGQEIVAYRLPNGQSHVADYRLLSAADPAGAAGSTAPTAVLAPTSPAPAPDAVGPGYEMAAPDDEYVYANDYYPWGWYPGPYLGLGYGYIGAWGGYRGGYAYRGGYGYRGGGGGYHGGSGARIAGSSHGGGGRR